MYIISRIIYAYVLEYTYIMYNEQYNISSFIIQHMNIIHMHLISCFGLQTEDIASSSILHAYDYFNVICIYIIYITLNKLVPCKDYILIIIS